MDDNAHMATDETKAEQGENGNAPALVSISIPPAPPAKRPKGFQKGNPGGRYKKSKATQETLRKAILDSATPKMCQELANALHARGLAGDSMAAKLWLEFTAGKPIEHVESRNVTLFEKLGVTDESTPLPS